MDDREGWRERVRDIRADGAMWWWWWYYYLHYNFCSFLNVHKHIFIFWQSLEREVSFTQTNDDVTSTFDIDRFNIKIWFSQISSVTIVCIKNIKLQ